jgi:hypothetical protein
LAANGSLTFYDVGTVTPRNTWSDYAQTTPNTNPLTLDPDARSPNQIYMDGDYTVACKDALGAVVWTRDIYSPTQAGGTIPALDNGKFLTNDGSNLLWAELLRVPDPTGSTNHYLTTDGANLLWTTIPTPPEIPDLEIAVTATTFQAGVSSDETKWKVLKGTDTVFATGTKYANKAISFPALTFSEVWCVMIEVETTAVTASGALPTHSVTGISASGFTANFNVPDDDTNASWNISADIPFRWIAFGTKEVPA